jgi:hypothetical protein
LSARVYAVSQLMAWPSEHQRDSSTGTLRLCVMKVQPVCHLAHAS